MKAKPTRYKCPHCKWDFAYRKKRCCPACGTLLLIVSDMLSDAQRTTLKSFWMWGPVKEKWDYIRDWEEHKVEAMRKFERHAMGKSTAGIEAVQTARPLTRWIQ